MDIVPYEDSAVADAIRDKFDVPFWFVIVFVTS